jgi:hypothetical protein
VHKLNGAKKIAVVGNGEAAKAKLFGTRNERLNSGGTVKE